MKLFHFICLLPMVNRDRKVKEVDGDNDEEKQHGMRRR